MWSVGFFSSFDSYKERCKEILFCSIKLLLYYGTCHLQRLNFLTTCFIGLHFAGPSSVSIFLFLTPGRSRPNNVQLLVLLNHGRFKNNNVQIGTTIYTYIKVPDFVSGTFDPFDHYV